MKFTCQKEDLQKVLLAAEPITGTKTNFSILSNVCFQAKDNNILNIMASNMEMTMSADIPAKIAKSGSITIFQNKLLNIIKELPNGDILFELKSDNRVVIKSMDKSRNAQAVILGIPKNDFPDIPAYPEKVEHITVDKIYYRKMIQKTIFAVSTDNMKYTLNGVFMECKKGLIKMVAIDGRRLALINSPIPKNDHEDFSTIIPQQFLQQLQKTLTSEGPLTFCFHDNRLHFKFDNLVLSTNILSGKFPNYNMFIPNSHENNFSCKTAEIQNAISLACVMVDTESNKMLWALKDNVLQIQASSTDYGESSEEIIVHYSGKETKLGINYKLLVEILKQIETDEAEFHFNNSLAPIMVKEKNRNEYFYIIMPMKLD